MKVLIKNGLIIDGTGCKGYKSNVLIEDNHILKIGNLEGENVNKVIKAEGKVVCPGFIDTHSHSDLMILINPFNETKIRQGITTEVLGQDGISMAPLPKKYISSWRKNLAGLDGDSDDIDWNYENTENYLAMIEKNGIGLNESYLVPHGNVRMEVLGLDNKQPTEEELKKMCEVTRREMKAGALGLSTGLIYMPCAYSETKELIEMCKVVADFDGVFVVHQRSEADSILESMEEVIEIGRKSGVKVHFSHFKVCGKKNWRYIDDIISLLERAKEEGVRVSFDQYPYVSGSTMLGVILPPWAHDGGTDKLLQRLKDTDMRKKMIEDMERGISGWDNFVDFAGLDRIFVTSVKTDKNKDVVGKNLIQIGKMREKNPYDATFDLLYEEENAVGMVDSYGLEEHVIRFMRRPEQNVCTDGLLTGRPHPRVFGSFPRILGKYVREEKVLSLEEAIYKMTKKPAEVFGLNKRGVLKEGNYADIVIFDPDKVLDKGTYVEPAQYPEGIEYVVINGKIVVNEEKYEKVLPGKVIKKII